MWQTFNWLIHAIFSILHGCDICFPTRVILLAFKRTKQLCHFLMSLRNPFLSPKKNMHKQCHQYPLYFWIIIHIHKILKSGLLVIIMLLQAVIIWFHSASVSQFSTSYCKPSDTWIHIFRINYSAHIKSSFSHKSHSLEDVDCRYLIHL